MTVAADELKFTTTTTNVLGGCVKEREKHAKKYRRHIHERHRKLTVKAAVAQDRIPDIDNGQPGVPGCDWQKNGYDWQKKNWSDINDTDSKTSPCPRQDTLTSIMVRLVTQDMMRRRTGQWSTIQRVFIDGLGFRSSPQCQLTQGLSSHTIQTVSTRPCTVTNSAMRLVCSSC